MFDPAEQEKALEEFLAKHVHPYDPETDDYDCPPFAADIKSEGRSPYYNFHYYHTKVPPEVIRDLIGHYTSPGDLVLDPFCGSGMTGLGALLADYEGSIRVGKSNPDYPRSVILSDLSPAACHIAANYSTAVEPDLVAKEFARIAATLGPDFHALYAAEHYEPAQGVYDPRNPEVSARLKTSPKNTVALLADTSAVEWELVSREEVEARTGYDVSGLGYCDKESRTAKEWLVIPAAIRYTVWSDVLKCEGLVTISTSTGRYSKRGVNAGAPILRKTKVARGCGRQINLWDCAVDKTTGEFLDSFACPHCNQVWSKSQLSRSHSEAVRVSYHFNGFKNRKGAIASARVSCTRPIGMRDKERIAVLDQLEIPDSFDDECIDLGREMMRHGLLKRGIKRISDFYTHRNLYGLALLWREILTVNDKDVRRKLRFCFTSQVMRASRLRRMRPFGPGEQLSGTLYIAALTVETNVLSILSHAVDEYCETFPRWMLRCPHNVFVARKSATELASIPDASVDFIFTDPPFGKNIFYADCAMLWENWLRDRTEESLEVVVNERRVGGSFKDIEDYQRLMELAFLEMARVLKPGRFSLVEFNNSDGAVFDAVKRAIVAAGFRVESMFVLDKGIKTFKQLKGLTEGEAVVDKDVMFTLSKPRGISDNMVSSGMDLEQQIAKVVRQHLQSLPERINADPARYSDEHRTTATINSMLMNVLIPRGVDVQRLNLPFIERVCARYFRKVGQRWYLRGEAVGGNGGDLIQEEVAIKDELTAIAWLRQKLESRPALMGELKPLWMKATGLLPASVSQSLMLEDLLISNFWRDEGTNRWREPTATERDRMNDDKTIRVFHDAERYVAGSLRRHTTDAERCEWIDALFQMCRALEDGDSQMLPSVRGLAPDEGYRLIVRLFQGILKDRVPQTVYGRAAKQAAVASQRIVKDVGDKAEKAKAKRRKDEGPTLFDL